VNSAIARFWSVALRCDMFLPSARPALRCLMAVVPLQRLVRV